MFTFVPAVVVPFFLSSPKSFNYDYIFFLIVFLLCFIYLQRNKLPKRSIIHFVKPLPKSILFPLLMTIYGVAIIVFIATFGFKFTVPSLEDVYDIRAQYKETTQGNAFARYLVGWMGYIINIFVFLIGLEKKNKTLIIGTIIFQFYIFSLMALKSHLATMLLVAIIYFLMKKYKSFSTNRFVFFVTSLIFLFFLLDFLFNDTLFQTLITRRILLVPSQLTYYHFEYFSQYPKTQWANSFMGGLLDYPYKMKPPNIIGDQYFNREEMTAVVNFFMEGYTAFGYIGVIIVTVLFKLFTQIIDYIFVYRTGQSVVFIALFFVLFNVMNSTSIFTLLLTHGLLLLILLSVIFPWSQYIGEKKYK